MDTRTSSSLVGSYRFARFVCVYFRYAAYANTPNASRETRTSRSGVKAPLLVDEVSVSNGNQLVEHVEAHLSCGTTWCCASM